MPSKQFTTFALAATLLLVGVPTMQANDVRPPFSWDRVPVYAHVGKVSGDFTSEELDFLAAHFDFITIEKHQASHKHGSTEAGFAVAAREIKKRNPKAKVLFYWNASLDTSSGRGVYEAMKTFPADGYLKDDQGRIIKRRGSVPNYDLTRPDVRAWWSDAAARAAHELGADGIFADAMDQREEKGLDDQELAALRVARVALLEETRRKIGPDKLIIYNGLMKGDPDKLLQYADGAMIESFCHPKYGSSKEVLEAYFEATRAAARRGKIVILKGWPGFSFRHKDMMQKPHAELVGLAKERITFPLACFLVAAEPNCYFHYTWGYREHHGTFDWYPEFDKPLGPPLGEATKTGWTYQREFAHASVSVNLETRKARIEWKSAENGDVPKTNARAARRKRKTYLPSTGKQKLNVVYKTIGNRELCFDIYYPTGRPQHNLPTVVYTHGGGWAAGSKQGIARGAPSRVALALLKAGVGVVSVDYRLYKKGGRVTMRDCVIDCKDAVRYLANNSESLGIDPNRLAVFGDSAGGQIAQMLLLSSPESLAGDPKLVGATYHVAAGVSWYGPCDFEKTELFNHDDRADFRDRFGERILGPNAGFEQKLKLYREMSPIQYLRKDCPPLLMIQGDKDTTIPVKHAYYMKERADAVGAPVEIMIIRNAGHNWRALDGPIKPTTDVIVQRTVQFLTEQLREHK